MNSISEREDRGANDREESIIRKDGLQERDQFGFITTVRLAQVTSKYFVAR